jgi:hypothetical protein
MAKDINTKDGELNSRVTKARDLLLCDYTNRNSCLAYGPVSSITNSYNSNVTPDVLKVKVVKDVVLSVYLTVCHVLSSDILPVLIDRNVEHSFTTHLTAPATRERTGPH